MWTVQSKFQLYSGFHRNALQSIGMGPKTPADDSAKDAKEKTEARAVSASSRFIPDEIIRSMK